MTCDELRKDAAGLAALPKGDPERQAAEAHAASCEGCQRELEAASRVMLLLDRLPAPAPPSAEVLARVRGQILADLRPRMLLRMVPLAVAIAFALLASLMHTRADEDSWIQALVVAAAAAMFGITATLRGRMAMGVAAAGSALFALTAAVGSGGAAPSIGMHCMSIELIGAAVPLAVTIALVMSKKAGGGPALFGAAAGVGALAAQAALHLACPVRSDQHLLAFHTGGVIVAMLVGLALSRLPMLRYSSAR